MEFDLRDLWNSKFSDDFLLLLGTSEAIVTRKVALIAFG